MQAFADKIDFVADALAPAPERNAEPPQRGEEHAERQYAGVAVAVDAALVGGVGGGEDGFVDGPAEAERGGEGEGHEDGGREDEASGGEADVWV